MDDLAYLFRLEQFGIKFGLESIETLLSRLGQLVELLGSSRAA